ncbi:MAG: helix-turn-helix domain-containing protein [Candidatus Micrarchaeota archaeon]
MKGCDVERCAIMGMADIFEKKWALKIVREVYGGKTHFNELKRSMKGVTAAVLSKRLKELEKSGIIKRKSARGKKADVEYTLGGSALHLMECWKIHAGHN